MDIKLKVPRVLDGVVRQPAEGVITVPDDFANGLTDDEADKFPETAEDDDHNDDDGLDAMTMPDLGILVTKEGVPLSGATKKADLIAAIRAHRASKEA